MSNKAKHPFLLRTIIHGPFKWIPDKKYLSLIYRLVFGKRINLANPRTYNEKLQWLKLYDRNPLYTQLVDKYEVKKYVSDIIGNEYIIKTLGIWNCFDEIDFNNLPNRFVLKCTHDSGGIFICNNKENLDISRAKKIINKSLKNNFFYIWREWPYKNVKPRIIAEEFIEDNEIKELRDYKFFCFDGAVKYLFVACGRQKNSEPSFDFYDSDFNHLDCINGHPNAEFTINKPKSFEKMKEIASLLSKGFPHVRIDLYDADGKIFFGEMTFYHFSGMVPFQPSKWDDVFGDLINLETIKDNHK